MHYYVYDDLESMNPYIKQLWLLRHSHERNSSNFYVWSFRNLYGMMMTCLIPSHIWSLFSPTLLQPSFSIHIFCVYFSLFWGSYIKIHSIFLINRKIIPPILTLLLWSQFITSYTLVLVHPPTKFSCDHNLYTLNVNIQDLGPDHHMVALLSKINSIFQVLMIVWIRNLI